MKVEPSTMSLMEYLNQLRAGTIVVNPEYQRSPRIWPPSARSYLIDTVLEGYPIPKIMLRQTVQLSAQQVKKEVIDGQQRSWTMLDFVENKFRLTQGGHSGATFSSLLPEDQRKVVEYTLTFDVFTNTTDDEVREIFRRLNAYTVPLNHQELRHANWQGRFKWFINGLSSDYAGVLRDWNVLTERQLARMADAELLTDITGAILGGIATGTKGYRDALYKANDKEFAGQPDVEERIETIFSTVPQIEGLARSALMPREIFYSLALAISHAKNPIDKLNPVFHFDLHQAALGDLQMAALNLSNLADALTSEAAPPQLSEFVEDVRQGTNTKERRGRRFALFCRALLPAPLL